jgi:hypothetical protein
MDREGIEEGEKREEEGRERGERRKRGEYQF